MRRKSRPHFGSNPTTMRRMLAVVAALPFLLGASPGPDSPSAAFPLGVAAGDVTSSSAVLWARAATPRSVIVEVAADEAFQRVVMRRSTVAAVERDATLKEEVAGLRPATRYYYRFSSGSARSAIGVFATAPPPRISANVTFAYSGDSDGTRVRDVPAFGSFAILDRVRAENPAFFIYLGDTIYSDSGASPAPAVTLDAYRAKYRENRRSSYLRNLFRSTSTIVMGDDHEVQNDYDPGSVPAAQFAAARQAFLEYMPIRTGPNAILYRSFRWGKELELFVLDTRSYRSPRVNRSPVCDNPPGSRAADLAPTLPSPLRQALRPIVPQFGLPVPSGCLAALADPTRTMLGSAQKAWLRDALQRSDATWKAIITSVPIGELFANPYDRWEGYAAERAEILTFIRSAGIRNVVWLTTDLHGTIVNDVRVSTFVPRLDPTGMIEVITGPIATTTFADAIARVIGGEGVPAFVAFVAARLPQGLGARCVELDRFSYAAVSVDATAKTLTVTPKDADGRAICPEPVVIRAAP